MCRYCVEYGDGKKWYLNPNNYTEELMKTPPHSEAVAALGGPDKNPFELSIASGADEAVPDVNYPDTVNMVLENMLNHAGQVVPIEDALKVVDLSFEQNNGEPWLVMHCACRKYFGQEPLEVCLFASPVAKTAGAARPWEKEQKRLNKEEVKEHIRNMSKARMVCGSTSAVRRICSVVKTRSARTSSGALQGWAIVPGSPSPIHLPPPLPWPAMQQNVPFAPAIPPRHWRRCRSRRCVSRGKPWCSSNALVCAA